MDSGDGQRPGEGGTTRIPSGQSMCTEFGNRPSLVKTCNGDASSSTRPHTNTPDSPTYGYKTRPIRDTSPTIYVEVESPCEVKGLMARPSISQHLTARSQSPMLPPTPLLALVPLPSITNNIIPTLSGVLGIGCLVGFDLARVKVSACPRNPLIGREEWWYSPATSPSTTCMVLRIPMIGACITVHSASSHGMLTVGDVMTGVHRQVREVVSEEWYYAARESLRSGQLTQSCIDAWPPYACNISWLALLGQCHRWVGLQSSRSERDVWELILR